MLLYMFMVRLGSLVGKGIGELQVPPVGLGLAPVLLLLLLVLLLLLLSALDLVVLLLTGHGLGHPLGEGDGHVLDLGHLLTSLGLLHQSGGLGGGSGHAGEADLDMLDLGDALVAAAGPEDGEMHDQPSSCYQRLS